MEDIPFETAEYEEQTKIKHAVLASYLDKWFTIIGRYNKLNYIDGFCGLGAYHDDKGVTHFGSPVLAILNYEKVHKPKGKKITFLFIDKQIEKLDNIKRILKKEKCETIPQYLQGDFDNVINDVLDRVSVLAPTFVLIDPFGFKGVKISTIKRIMERDKTEILLNFMFTRINEFLSAPNVASIFSEYFGPCEWASLAALHGFEREKALMSLYRNQLKRYAKVRYVYPYPIEFPNSRRTYYYLFHLTNYWLGCSIMKSVFAGLNYNRLAYLGNRSNQLSFMDTLSFKKNDLKKYLVEMYKGKQISYIDLIKNEIDEVPYKESEIKGTLKEMENKEIDVKRITSTTSRGLQEDDICFFRRPCQ